jgi:hypothetical protein
VKYRSQYNIRRRGCIQKDSRRRIAVDIIRHPYCIHKDSPGPTAKQIREDLLATRRSVQNEGHYVNDRDQNSFYLISDIAQAKMFPSLFYADTNLDFVSIAETTGASRGLRYVGNFSS